MSETILYHNPRCSKSRQTLSLLSDQGINPKVIEYLKLPPTVEELKEICQKLNRTPQQITRIQEEKYRELCLANQKLSDAQYLKILAENPILIERPIVVHGNQARIGRPPEQVLELFK